MPSKPELEPEPTLPYLAMFPVDIERWQSSGAYRRMSLGAQGAYLNLCFAAWKAQPSCGLPDDDRDLWRLANASSILEWRAIKSEVFASGAWALTDQWGWLNEVVLETYMDSARRHAAAVRSGRIAGRASAKVRREAAKVAAVKQHRTAVDPGLVERPSTQERSTAVDPLSLSLSLSQAKNNPPTPQGGRRRRGQVEPQDIHPALSRYKDAFNRSFSRNLENISVLNVAFRKREAGGIDADTLVALPVLLAAQAAQGLTEIKCGASKLNPGWLLRDGSGRYGGEDGGTRNTKDWIGSILGLADQTTIGPELLPLVDELGLRDAMRRLGVKRRSVTC